MFRTEVIKHVRDQKSITSVFADFSHSVAEDDHHNEKVILDIIEELKELNVQLREQENRLADLDMQLKKIATSLYGQEQLARLQAANLMLYNPDKIDVATFTSRLEFMATLKGEVAVLRVVLLCLKGRALEWHNGLLPKCWNEMAMSLAVTVDELQSEFQLSEGEAWN
ncbi:hypothetical protein PABG_01852 [Paracoccidioides brasiliensis Pb03]|nr:hypothetical protein PABG_01852 [Paracoccidioides brasiliensis Pb03]